MTQKSNLTNRLQVCFNAVEIGLAAEIIDKSKTVREKINNRILSTTVGIISTLPSYQSNRFKIILDRGKKIINTNLIMGIVANGVYLAGGFRPAYNSRMNDG